MFGHLIGKRRWFRAVVGDANGHHLLLLNVRFEDGRQFRDHLWIAYGKRWRVLDLEEGDVLKLYGKVNRYYDGNGAAKRPKWEITNISEFEKVVT